MDRAHLETCRHTHTSLIYVGLGLSEFDIWTNSRIGDRQKPSSKPNTNRYQPTLVVVLNDAQTKKKPLPSCEDNGFCLVVDYSRLANTHPAGVRRTVLKLPLNEEYGVHPRICSNHLTGSGNSGPVRVSTACSNLVALT